MTFLRLGFQSPFLDPNQNIYYKIFRKTRENLFDEEKIKEDEIQGTRESQICCMYISIYFVNIGGLTRYIA